MGKDVYIIPKGQINAPDQLDCMSTLRTDNSQTLIAGMRSELTEKQQYIIQLEAHIGLLGSEIERLKEVINLQVENYAELKEQQEAQHGYFNSVMVENDQAKKAEKEIERKSAALRVALDALKGADYIDYDMRDAITTINEALK